MAVFTHFQLTPDDEAFFQRVEFGSELEVRLSSIDYMDNYTSLTKETYETILNGLNSSPFKTEKGSSFQEYTNDIYSIPNYKMVSLRETNWIQPLRQSVIIQKEKVNRPTFRKQFHGFELRMTESIERNGSFKGGEVKTMKRHIWRNKIEVQIEGVKYSYDCSVVESTDLSRAGSKPVVTYEIELELPFDGNLADYARVGISYLLELMYQSSIDRRFFFKGMPELEKDIDTIRRMTYSKENARFKPVSSTELNIRNDPVNLKKEFIPRLNDFAMTNKLDGERRLIVGLGTNEVLILHPNGYIKQKLDSAYYINLPFQVPIMVLDAEYYQNTFYIFDVIQPPSPVEQAPMIAVPTPHQTRMLTLQKDVALMDALAKSGMQFKTFYYGTLDENLKAFISNNPAKEWFDHNDGLIFTQKNESYIKAVHYKFKFTSKMSIDFAVSAGTRLNNNQIQYDLLVARRAPNKPIQLVPFGDAKLITFSEYPVNTILECVYLRAYNRWSVLRARGDKTVPNSERTASSVYEDIEKPISMRELSPNLAEEYLRQIEKEDRLFQSTIYLEKKQLLNHFFDLNIDAFIYMCSIFFGITDQRYNKDVYQNMFKFFMGRASDDTITRFISTLNNSIYSLYDKVEANSLQSYLHSILKTSPYQTTVFDARMWTDIEHDKLAIIPPMTGYREVKNIPLPVNPDIKFGQFSKQIISIDPSYNDFVTVEDHSNPKEIRYISQYSSLMPWHKKQVEQVMKAWFTNPVAIADLTANIGVDVIHTASMFPNARIEAFEIEPTFHNALVQNLTKMNIANVKAFLLDSNFAVQQFVERQFNYVYIDAPWGGKIKPGTVPPPTDLFLQAEADQEKKPQFNIKAIACYLLYKKKVTQAVVIKVPTFYKSNDLSSLFNVEKAEIINERDNKVSYVMYKLTPLQKIAPVESQSLIGLWSIPYVDRVERLFQLTSSQKHLLVRVPIDMVAERSVQLFYQYHFLPFAPEMKVIDFYELSEVAAKNNYQVVNQFDTYAPNSPDQKTNYRYYHFVSTSILQQPPQAPQAQVQPVQKQRQSVVQTVAQQQGARMFQPPGQRPFPQKCVVKQDPLILSSTDHMRRYHNNEKRILINMFCRNRSVLDLGAGYGGDLHKYNACKVTRLVMVEPNTENINSQEEPEGLLCRIQKSALRDKISVIQAYGQDTATIVEQEIIPNGRVEVVASFFSLTFLFESRQVLRNFLNTVNSCLIEGGYFIGTMMEGEKTFDQFRGVEQMTLGTADMIKKYSDASKLPKGDTGMKLWINIKDTIVKNQDEYLAFFSVLTEEAARFGLELKLVYDFDPSRYYEYDQIEQGDRAFSRLCVGFAFRKMPKTISSLVSMLQPDSTFDFINLYGEMTPMIRTGVLADGSCFYHAFLYNTDEFYRQSQEKERKAMAAKLRVEFAQKVDADSYFAVLPHELFYILEDKKDKLFNREQLAQFNQVVPRIFDKTVFKRQVSELTEDVLLIIKRVIDSEVRKLQEEIANPIAWADEKHISLFIHFKKMNIYFIDSATRRPTLTFFMQYKPSYRYSTVLFVINDSHYEPLAFVRNQKAYRMLTAFDPSLVLVHHWLIGQTVEKPAKPAVEEKAEQKEESLESLLFDYKPISNPNNMIETVSSDASFVNLLGKFYKKPVNLFEKGKDDRSVVTYLKKLIGPQKENPVVAKSRKTSLAKKKATEITQMIQDKLRGPVTNYLDIGCSDGTTTVMIGELLGLSKDNIYGIDVEDFAAEAIQPDTSKFQFHRYQSNEVKLPYADQTFDVITLLVTLHHVNHPIAMLKEIKRILKPNGLVLFREHDRTDEKVDKLIRLEHLFYSQLIHQVDYEMYMSKKSEQYFSKSAFIRVMDRLSFKILEDSQVREVNNPTKLYYILFTK
jgi:ubiquinone/menaquinone biosynthesis C-methylase UbiE